MNKRKGGIQAPVPNGMMNVDADFGIDAKPMHERFGNMGKMPDPMANLKRKK